MNEKHLIEELKNAAPLAPAVRVPRLETIEGIVRRRTALRNQLLTVGCLVVCAGFVGFVSRRSDKSSAENSSRGIDFASQQASSFTPRVQSISEADMSTIDVTSTIAGAESAQARDGLAGDQEVRVYATVIEAVPVFRFEENSQVYRHLGWVDQQRVVPVDLSELSAAQQQSFEAVLQESNQPTYYNL